MEFAVDGRAQGLGLFGKVDAHGPVHSGLGRVLDRSVSRVWVCFCQFSVGRWWELSLFRVRARPAELDLELLVFEYGV